MQCWQNHSKSCLAENFSKKCLLKIALVAIIRECAVKALIESWDEVCTKHNCSTAAEIIGTYPQDLDKILSNSYVHDLTREDEQRISKKRKTYRLNINGKVVTKLENLKEINDAIHQKDAFRHLCVTGPVDYVPFCIEKSKYEFDDVILFSKFHHYSCPNEAPVFF